MSDVNLRNTSPLGDIQIPSLGIEVAAGKTFSVSKEIADDLLKQDGNYELATPAKTEKKD